MEVPQATGGTGGASQRAGSTPSLRPGACRAPWPRGQHRRPPVPSLQEEPSSASLDSSPSACGADTGACPRSAD